MKVAVGISGGVDSTVAALLLKEAGYDVVGYVMTLGRRDEDAALAATRAVAERLDVPLRVCDFATDWKRGVLDDLRTTYLSGTTPNPCVRCNERVKFGSLPRTAFADGCARFATGHYARLEDGRLFRAADLGKDQSYFLYRVAPDVLSRTLLPLGTLTKAEVRDRARAFGLAVADEDDSQDFCGGDPLAYVGAEARPGEMVTTDGRVVAKHGGFWNFTIGQRKGLGIGGGGTPYYVVRLDAARNEVVVGVRVECAVRSFDVVEVVGPSLAALDVCAATGEPLRVKVRSAGEPKGPVTVERTPSGLRVRAADGLTGVAPGQSAVFFRADEILGGGIIAP